jgi:hypothetical protein
LNFKGVEEKNIGSFRLLLLLFTAPLLFLFAGIGVGLVEGGIWEVLLGLKNIVLSPTILFTDFIEVGGLAATFINVALIGFLNIYMIHFYKLKVNGVLIAAFFTVMGFSFFGKNIYNIIPIYLGGHLYTKYQKISFKEIIVVLMFGTALAPMISEISFAGFLPGYVGPVVAVLVGIFIGFVIVPLSSHMLKFHDGYNLYNIGFTSGIIGTVLTGVLRSFGVTVAPADIIYKENSPLLVTLVLIIFIGLMLTGVFINKNVFKEYRGVFKYKGRLITDYTHLVGYGVTFFNMSLLGLMSVGYVMLIGGVLNGPVMAAVFTVSGFGALGKNFKNCLPIMAGTIVTALIFGYDLSSTGIIISVLFSTTLAPVAGAYGAIAGFVAGVLHMVLVTNVGVIHGGINLYNNGFSGGIVAAVLIPIIDAFKKEKYNAA